MNNLSNLVHKMISEPSLVVEKITPNVAEKFLSLNTSNRNISEANVSFLAKEMSLGLWRNNGETIKFSKSGKLIDGQHRLHAIIKSNTYQDMCIVRGLDDDSFTTIDTGKARSGADVLYLSGFNYATNLSSITRNVLVFRRFKTFHSNGKYKPSNTEIRNEAISNKKLAESATFSGNTKASLIPKSALGVFHYYFGLINKAERDEFFDKLINCYGDKDDPAVTLNKFLHQTKQNKLAFCITLRTIAPYIVRAFEYQLQGKYCNKLVLKRDNTKHLELLIGVE